MRDPDFTLAGGPTTVHPRVLAALGKPITHHCAPGGARQVPSPIWVQEYESGDGVEAAP